MSHRRHTEHNARTTGGTNSGIRDIGLFIKNYNNLSDKLYPVFAVWEIILYVTRWENYLLTLAVILVFSLLFYFPSVLFSLLTLASILFMGLGRYHGQTKAIIALRKPPAVELLDPEQQELRKQHSEEGNMHKSRLEFRQILSNAEKVMLNAGNFVDYIYNVYLWKSPEVSLCVTVLLCVVLVLLCTVELNSIGAAIPIIVLCSNKYFFSRSIDLWTQLLTRLKQKLQRRKQKRKKTNTFSGMKSSRLKDKDRDENEEEEEDEDEVEEKKVDDTEEERLLVDHESSNEAGSSDVALTSELRHRAGARSQSLVDQSTGTTTVVGGNGETVVKSEDCAGASESESWVPVSGPQSTRKDGKSPQQELCSKCQTSFFLKRKHNCNVCGQTFCGSCTAKVKRAALGATSPTAFETSVRVCLNCKVKLDDYTINKE